MHSPAKRVEQVTINTHIPNFDALNLPSALKDLAMTKRGLIPKKDGSGRMAAIEIMLNSPLISDLIFKGEVHEIGYPEKVVGLGV